MYLPNRHTSHIQMLLKQKEMSLAGRLAEGRRSCHCPARCSVGSHVTVVCLSGVGVELKTVMIPGCLMKSGCCVGTCVFGKLMVVCLVDRFLTVYHRVPVT